METLRGNGNVLMPVDTAGRVLEILLTLECWWQHQRLGYPLFLLNNVSKSMVESAGTFLEWGSDEISEKFSNDRINPYEFKHVRCISTLEELQDVQGPKVVLATSSTLDSGFAREIFLNWSNDHRNQILFTQRGGPNSLSTQLLVEPKPRLLQLTRWVRVPLEGEELVEWKKKEAAAEKQRQIELEKQQQLAFEKAQQLIMENALVVASDSDEELELATSSNALATTSRGGKFSQPWYPVFGATKAVNPALEHGAKLDPMTGRLMRDQYGVNLEPHAYMDQYAFEEERRRIGGNGNNNSTKIPGGVTQAPVPMEEDEVAEQPTKAVQEQMVVQVHSPLLSPSLLSTLCSHSPLPPPPPTPRYTAGWRTSIWRASRIDGRSGISSTQCHRVRLLLLVALPLRRTRWSTGVKAISAAVRQR
jgi:hypothetical protein